MTCSGCGFQNREGKRFCVECGTVLALPCRTCQADLEPGQKFCGECGTPTASAPTAPTAVPPRLATAAGAVRKTVTVLFADLGGSTSFGERTDAELAREVMARYHAILQDVIDAHAGTVAKFMGDGMMATFGIPEIAEDDARRAVNAGGALQQRFEAFAVDVDRQYGETLTLRVGINTGEVVIASGDADLIGDALNVAARLEKACRPGHVLVGEETWRLTRGDFGYESLGEVTVAGRTQPVAIHELAPEAETASESTAPFVGRDAEMGRLVGVFDDARATATARLATVLGSPGVGKTRLSRELCARVAEIAGAQTVEIRCDRAGEATFAPIAQLIREATGLSDDADADAARAAIGSLLPETESEHARIADVLAGLVGAAPTRSVEETFWAIRRLVESVAANQPLVVVIDDIQWAEPLFLDLLEHLAEWVSGVAFVLLCLARPELREVRPSLVEPGRRVADVLALDGLDSAATEALAAGLLGTDRLPPGLVERLPASTDGNPLFVRELVRMLVDDEVIRRAGDGEWELAIDAEAVEVPPTIQSLLAARVERLPANEREVLEYASVVGAEFSLGALRALAGDRVPLTSVLEGMRRKELVEPTGTYWGDEPVHRFHHVLIRDATYRRLLKTTRAQLHERVAMWTDRTAANLIGEHEAVVAFHYEQAYRYRAELGSLDDHVHDLGRRGAELLSTASQRALGRDDLAAAGALAKRALDLLPASDTATRAEMLLVGCECLLASGDGVAARPLVEELSRSAGGDRSLGAWAACFEAQLIFLMEPEGLLAADETVSAAATTFTELGDGAGEAKAHQVRAGLLARLGRVGDAELELDLALAAARSVDDRRRVTAVLGAAPDAALFGPSPVARAGGRCLDVVRLLRITTASPSVEATSNRCQAVLESLRGRFDVSRSMLASARATLEELGLRHGLAQTDLCAGMVEMIAGDPHAAIAPLRAAYGGLGALGVGADAGNAAALLARALLVDGAVDEADAMATASKSLAGQNLKTAIGWRVARAEVLAAQGDPAAAVAIAEQAVEIAAGTDLIIDHADACVALAALRNRAGDAAGARVARAEAKRLYDLKGATVPAARLAEEETSAKAVRSARPAETVERRSMPTQSLSAHKAAVTNRATELAEVMANLTESGDFDAVASMIVDEYVRIDHRAMPAPESHGPAGYLAIYRATLEVGLDAIARTPLAVRGDRLHLSRIDVRADDRELVFLQLQEYDERDRLGWGAHFDEVDIVSAQAELDARYLAGEGAEHAAAIRPMVEQVAAFHARDWDALAESVRDAEFVDHRGLWAGGGPDAYVEAMQSLAATAPDATIVTRQLHVRGDAVLMTTDVRATATQGDRYDYTFHLVGRPGRREYFDEDDLAAALARLDELGTPRPAAPPIAPMARLENTATRVEARAFALLRSMSDRELGELMAPDFVFDDRRHVVNFGVSDLAASAAHLEWSRHDGQEYAPPKVVAIRGDRLALSRRTQRNRGGYDRSSFGVVEIDEQSRWLALVQFDEEDLDAAVDELDTRYMAGEGAPHARTMSVARAAWIAMRDGDLESLELLLAPDLVTVDHQRIGFGTHDRDSYLDQERSDREVMHRDREYAVNGFVSGDAVLVVFESKRHDQYGSGLLYQSCGLVRVDASDRVDRIEWFDLEDWDAALARFDELSAPPTDPRNPRVENSVTLGRSAWGAMIRNGRFDEARARLGKFVAEGAVRVDRRSTVAAPDADGPGVVDSLQALYELGMVEVAADPIAVRGETLALYRQVFRSAGGDELVFLTLQENDAENRAAFIANYEEGQFAAAVEELDARYVAGEGAEHAERLNALNAVLRGMEHRDPGALAEHFRPDASVGDRRRLSWPTTDAQGFAEQLRSYDDLDQTYLIRTVQFSGQASLVTIENGGADADGREFVWVFHMVGQRDPTGRATGLEMFDEDDWDAAVTRFDELAAEVPPDSRNPRAENAATRAADECARLVAGNRLDEAERLFAEGYVRTDRRSGVAAPDAHGGRDFVEAYRGFFDVGFDVLTNEYLAVRGDRLHLARVRVRTGDGRELVFLHVAEFDESGRAIAGVNFDEDDLIAAIEELDARYLRGEGAAHGDVLRAFNANAVAVAARDYPGMQALASPDFEYVDHRLVSWGTLTRQGFADMRHGYDDLPTTILTTKLYLAPQSLIARTLSRGVSEDGTEVEWLNYCVWACDAAGLGVRSEVFDESDWDAALARFDELAGDPTLAEPTVAPTLENEASRRGLEMAQLTNAGDTEGLATLIAPSFEALDRRSVTFGPTSAGDEFLAGAAELVTVFDEIVRNEVVAIRGDRLCLDRSRFVGAGGFDVALLGLTEVDDEGRVLAAVMFDPGDLAGAFQELEDRYAAGEGASEAYVLGRTADFARADAARDWAAVSALFAPDAVVTDHRAIGQGWSIREDFVVSSRAVVDLVPDVVHVIRQIEVRGSVILTNAEAFGATREGNDYAWSYRMVAAWVGGRISRFDLFDVADEEAARSRFEVLAEADPRTPALDNDVVRFLARGTWLHRFEPTHDPFSGLADDLIVSDHRSGVTLPDLHGAAELVEASRAQEDLFGPIEIEPVAVRGDRIALVYTRAVAESGFETGGYGIFEMNDAGQQNAMTFFDDDDLAGALEEMERRHEELSRDAYAPVERTYARATQRLSHGDMDGWRACLSPTLRTVDHRPIVGGEVRGDPSVHMAAWRDLAPNLVILRPRSFVRRDVMLSSIAFRSTTPAAGGYEWDLASVVRVDGDGLIAEQHLFEIEEWDEARARFDEWTRSDDPAAVAPPLDNAAMHYLEAAEAFFADGGDLTEFAPRWFAADIVRTDRRSGVAGPDIQGRDSYADAFAKTAEMFSAWTWERVAVRGERLALGRLMGTSSEGFELPYLILVEVDDAGCVAFLAHFDDDELLGALQELDDRYCVGEGAEHAYALRRFGDFGYAYRARDWPAVTSLFAADAIVTDHRAIGQAWSTREDFVTSSRAAVDLVPDVMHIIRQVAVRGSVILTNAEAFGTTREGNEYAWSYRTVLRYRAGLIAQMELFDAADDARTRDRFDELTAGHSGTPAIDNDAVQVMARVEWVARFDFSRAAELFSPDVEYTDRRRLVSLPTLTGVEAMGEMYSSIFAVFDDLVMEPVAVRAERLALFHTRTSTDGGAESLAYMIGGLDDAGRFETLMVFDEDDLIGAVEELERRHRELSGDAYTAVEHRYFANTEALNRREWGVWEEGRAVGYSVVDHSPFGAGQADSGFMSEYMRGLIDQVRGVAIFPAKVFARGDLMLSYIPFSGETSDGRRYEWEYAQVTRVDAAGLIAEEHFFQIEQWDEALSLFDEWSAGPPASAGLPSNQATRWQDAYTEAFAARDWEAMTASYAADVVNDDRRTGVSSGVTVGRAELLALVRGLADVGFATVTTVPIAIRGERVALVRRTWYQADGFDLPLLAVVEYDADGQLTANVMFDADNEVGATEELERRNVAGNDGGSSELFAGRADPAWDRDRDPVDHSIRDPWEEPDAGGA